jgi:hypothetical protein
MRSALEPQNVVNLRESLPDLIIAIEIAIEIEIIKIDDTSRFDPDFDFDAE